MATESEAGAVATPTGWLGKIDKVTSNGTVVALMTAVLALIVVPRIASKLDAEKQLRAQRLKVATEFLARNTETEVDLNSLLTTLVLFDKDNNAGLSKRNEYKEYQRSMRKQVDAQYQKIDQKMWWWYWELTMQARVSNVISASELTAVENLNRQYGDNLVQATNLINEVWAALLRGTYKPGDPQNTALIKQTQEKLDELREKRNDLAMKYVQIFAGK